MPPIKLSVTSHLGNFDLEYSQLEEADRKKILEESCSIIEDKLADMKFLGEFTWNGKQAFYNDEPGGGSEKLYAYQGDHLKDGFSVSLDAGAYNFIIENSKEVYSTKYKFNLFELLWDGFGPYRVPTRISHSNEEQTAYYMRTKKMKQKFYSVGGPFIKTDNANLMTFYYRYQSQWYYNISDRQGMAPSLTSKFRDYIHTAISRGIDEAIERTMPSDVYEIMRGTA